MTDDAEFDARRLRRLDRPHAPDDAVDARIRSAMLAAFDDAVDASSSPSEPSDSPAPVIELHPTGAPDAAGGGDGATRPRRGRGTWSRARLSVALVAVAAVVLAIAGIAVVGPFDGGEDELEPLDQTGADAIAVTEFCTTVVNPLAADIADYHANGGDERVDRAFRNLELIAQGLVDLGSEIGEPMASDVVAAGGDLLTEAAAIRRDQVTEDAVDRYAADVADLIDETPHSEACDTEALRP